VLSEELSLLDKNICNDKIKSGHIGDNSDGKRAYSDALILRKINLNFDTCFFLREGTVVVTHNDSNFYFFLEMFGLYVTFSLRNNGSEFIVKRSNSNHFS
jgi:hypothetical protein